MVRAWRWCLLALALALWHAHPVTKYFMQPEPAAAGARVFTVFHFNAGANHGEPQRILAHLRRYAQGIDAIVIVEATQDFELALNELRRDFPHQVRHLADTPFGIALASKHPLKNGTVVPHPHAAFPHIEAVLRLPGRAEPLSFFAVHAPPPINGRLAAARNAKLAHIAAQAAARSGTTPLAVGDFNVTPWSPYFTQFTAASGLRAAHNATSLDHTWPVAFGSARLGLAIDHSFAHPALRLVSRVIGPDLGSDHLPVTVRFAY
jgi:endonuclease/exonuclease/phosphatase (EEP) superfamily protein YafD